MPLACSLWDSRIETALASPASCCQWLCGNWDSFANLADLCAWPSQLCLSYGIDEGGWRLPSSTSGPSLRGSSSGKGQEDCSKQGQNGTTALVGEGSQGSLSVFG